MTDLYRHLGECIILEKTVSIMQDHRTNITPISVAVVITFHVFVQLDGHNRRPAYHSYM